MASSSTASKRKRKRNQSELENAFEQPEPYQNLRKISAGKRKRNLIPKTQNLSRQTQSDPQNAFDEVAPSFSASASASTEPWQIFISHRGSDVKYTLASKIHHKFDGMGFRAFLDVEELEPGDVIPAEIQAAMESASLHIAIFSPNYAQSTWCLAELSFMLKSGKKIIPIFYHVEPSDLRWIEQGKGKYAHAFSDHRKKGRYTQEKLNEWTKALHDISFHSGYEVKNNTDETTVLKNIVNCALKVTKNVPLWVAEHPIGLDELVQGFQSVTTEDKVKITGIVGMGGSGKTTLAKELFNRNFSSFEKCSFVSDVRDAASRNALLEKQRKLLTDLGVHYLSFDSVDEGKAVLGNRLGSHRVLIVLDDVDHIDQLNALLPNKDNFGSQSMVVVTSRELGVLESWGLSSIYKMPGLGSSHAKQLFCWHAFLQPSPPAQFEALVEEFLKACDGLPLSLKVLGAQLYGKKSKDYWESQLHKILKILPSEIQQRLQLSYDVLDEEEKEMFLDVACFLIGELKSTAIAVWDGMHWSGLHGLQTLVNKCLVELVYEVDDVYTNIVYREKLRMHDHLRDMGREIARRHSSYRLWRPQFDNIKNHFKKEMPIQGIRPPATFVALKKDTQLVGISNGLKILHVERNEFTENFASLSKHLVWLRWNGFPLNKFPPWLTLRNLSVLEIHGANELEELWEDKVDPPEQLRELIIQGSRKLQRLPRSLGCLQYLKKLLFDFDGSGLPEQFCGLRSLEYLRLFSPQLSSLPDDFGNLISLKSIHLVYCKKLSALPHSFDQLIHLQDLNMSFCEMLSSLPDGFGNLISLESIALDYCKQLSTLPDSFKQLIHLQYLYIAGCEMLSSLPDGFGNLINLKSINLMSCKQLSTLPDSFKKLTLLEKLVISGSEMMFSLPDGFGNLVSLKSIHLSDFKQLSTLPDSFKQLIHLEDLFISDCERMSSLPDDLGNLISLKSICLRSCKQLNILPDSFKRLTQLERLYIIDCEMLPSLLDVISNLISLKFIKLESCKQLSTLPDSFMQLIHLEDLEISGCEMLPDSFGKLINLKSIHLKSCKQLRTLPDSLKELIHLEDLFISDCEIMSSLPDVLCNLISLKSICLRSCRQLNILPDSFRRLTRLERLCIIDCEMLCSLPDVFSNLIRLKFIQLESCKQLRTLPDSFTQLMHLENLEISGCEMLSSLPDSFGNLISLKSIHLKSCKQLRTFPDSFKQLIHLEKLTIADCEMLSSLPDSFIKLIDLKSKDLVSCSIALAN